MPYKDKKKQLEYYKLWRKKNSNYNKQYRQTEKAKLGKKKYQQSKKGKLAHQKDNKKWRENHLNTICELKINGCAICGYNKCDRALQFHHVNPKDKKFNITIARVTSERLIDELHKCILLCANCHYEIHAL